MEGEVKDRTGEQLPFATILILPDSTIVPADLDGRFSVKVLQGQKNVLITFTGYQVLESSFLLMNDTTLSFTLSPGVGQLKEVTIKADRSSSQKELVQSTRTGTTVITKKDVTGIPVFGGEADVIKTLQLLPGTVRGVEGSSDLFVRGGAADQNLVLLDGAPIYNTSHLFGFLSVFNSDILEKVESINGGFPAEYGGRLSSILDITTNNRIASKTLVSGDIGLIASRLYLEQPLVKNRASIWVSGRRTYIDQVVKAIGEELPYFFYDLNGKLVLKPTDKDIVSFSHYSGEDILNFYVDDNQDGRGFISANSSGNSSQSFQWRRNNRSGWDSKLSLTRTVYAYDTRSAFEENELRAISEIEDYSARITFDKDSAWMNAHVTAGVEWIRHDVSPNLISSAGFFSDFLPGGTISGKIANEVAVHVQQEWDVLPRLRINTGFRGSMGILAKKTYFIPEPRLSLRYKISEGQALKLSYSRMAQYMHRISNSAASTPADIWYPVTADIKPQNSHQVSAAWQMFLDSPKLFFSIEGYFKSLDNLIGYEEGTNLFFNTDFESRLIQGQGKAYGVEFLARKDVGKFTGWLSYSLAWSYRQFNEMNRGEWFPARYDRRHNGAVVGQYTFHPRWAASVVWEFISGSRFTPVIGQYIIPAPTMSGVDLVPLFADVNSVKLSDTHRLDLGLKFMSRPDARFGWHLFAGVNNVYNRASPVGIIIETDRTNGSLRYSQPGLFGLLPFFSFGFRF